LTYSLGAKLVIILSEIFNRAYVAPSVPGQRGIGSVRKLAHWQQQQQHCERKEPRLAAKVLWPRTTKARNLLTAEVWAGVCRPL